MHPQFTKKDIASTRLYKILLKIRAENITNFRLFFPLLFILCFCSVVQIIKKLQYYETKILERVTSRT